MREAGRIADEFGSAAVAMSYPQRGCDKPSCGLAGFECLGNGHSLHMKILIALDESDASHDAARYATDLLGLQPQAVGSDHEVLVLRVHDSVTPFAYLADPISGAVVYPDSIPMVMEAQRKADEAEEASLRGSDDPALTPADDIIVEHGDAGRTICEVAAARDIDLIVVGSRDRGMLSRILHPSVSGYLVHHAPCPVLVVR